MAEAPPSGADVGGVGPNAETVTDTADAIASSMHIVESFLIIII